MAAAVGMDDAGWETGLPFFLDGFFAGGVVRVEAGDAAGSGDCGLSVSGAGCCGVAASCDHARVIGTSANINTRPPTATRFSSMSIQPSSLIGNGNS